MKQIIAGIVIAGALSACAGTGPTTPSAQSSEATVAIAPIAPVLAQDGAVSGPKEDPKAPQDPKAPEDPKGPQDPQDPKDKDPQPAPQPQLEVRRATTTSAHWYTEVPTLPASFDVVTTEGMITFGPCPATGILIHTPTSLFARPCGANLQVVEEMWTFSGLQGQAGGTIR